MEFVENDLVWARLRKDGVVECERTGTELHLDLDESTDVVGLDVASSDHARVAKLPTGVVRVPRAEFGPIVEGVLHKLRIVEAVVIPVGVWRQVFDVVSECMSNQPQWADIDSAAAVELNTRDPLFVGSGSHHLLRDLVNSIVTKGSEATQGITVVALGVRLMMEVLPCGEMILLAGDAHLARSVRAVVDHHAGGNHSPRTS
ncbi:MAG: hypothetical protein JNK53_02885 [Phycisphaerae bacterium]|nr:hypothetical protein [Phycisphaerae bacterium]